MSEEKYDLKDIRLVALDLDGTLLDDHLNVSERTSKTIINLINRGINVTLVSGRPYKAVEFVREKLKVDMPVVAYNGGMVVIPRKGEIFSMKIPLEEALKVIKYGEERDLYVKVYIDDILYINAADERSIVFSETRNINYKVVGKLSENIKDDVNMIVMYYDKDINGVIDEKIEKIGATITTSGAKSIDVIPKGISKENGLRMIAENLNIKRENILAVGNSLNDIEMLRYAGIGIALKNSDMRLLKVWDNICKYTNNEEAIYHIISQI